jgi:hypothetical protein
VEQLAPEHAAERGPRYDVPGTAWAVLIDTATKASANRITKSFLLLILPPFYVTVILFSADAETLL